MFHSTRMLKQPAAGLRMSSGKIVARVSITLFVFQKGRTECQRTGQSPIILPMPENEGVSEEQYRRAIQAVAKHRVEQATEILTDLGHGEAPTNKEVAEYTIDHLMIEGKSEILLEVRQAIRKLCGV
jgi:hypothetical protein